jgi:hypothetical protein
VVGYNCGRICVFKGYDNNESEAEKQSYMIIILQTKTNATRYYISIKQNIMYMEAR